MTAKERAKLFLDTFPNNEWEEEAEEYEDYFISTDVKERGFSLTPDEKELILLLGGRNAMDHIRKGQLDITLENQCIIGFSDGGDCLDISELINPVLA